MKGCDWNILKCSVKRRWMRQGLAQHTFVMRPWSCYKRHPPRWVNVDASWTTWSHTMLMVWGSFDESLKRNLDLKLKCLFFESPRIVLISVVAFGHVEMTQRACFPPDPICVLIATLCWQDVETWKTGAHVEAFGIRKLSLSIQDAASLQWEAELEGCWEEYQRRSPERESHFRWNIGMISKFYWNSSLFVPASFDILHHSSHPLFLWHMSSINEYLRYGYIYLFGTSYVRTPEMMNTPRHANAQRRLPEDLPQPGAAQVVDLSDEDCCVLDSQWHDFYLSSDPAITGSLPVAATLIFSTIQHWWNWRLEIMVYIASGLKCSWVWSVSKILDIQKGGAVPEVLQPVAEKADKRWHEHTSAMSDVMQRFSWAHFLNLNDSLDGSLPRRGWDWDLSGAGSSGWVQDIVSRLHSS